MRFESFGADGIRHKRTVKQSFCLRRRQSPPSSRQERREIANCGIQMHFVLLLHCASSVSGVELQSSGSTLMQTRLGVAYGFIWLRRGFPLCAECDLWELGVDFLWKVGAQQCISGSGFHGMASRARSDRSKRRKPAPCTDTDTDSVHAWPFLSHLWHVSGSWGSCGLQSVLSVPWPVCKRVALAFTLLGVNAMLFCYNMKMFLPGNFPDRHSFRVASYATSFTRDSDEPPHALSPAILRQKPSMPGPLPSWTEPRKPAAGQILSGTSGTDAADVEDAMTQADRLMAYALLQNTTQIVRFRTHAWTIPTLTLAKGQELPYPDKVKIVSRTEGEYAGNENVVFLSPCSAHSLHSLDIPFGDFVLEKAAFLRMNCSKKEQSANLASRLVVVYMNLRESGYFGHAIDNVLPRAFAVVEGARRAGHRVSLVLPPLGRRSMSENTKLLCKFLGLELLQRVPLEPHRVVGVSGVAAWSRELRQALQQAIWRSPLLQGLPPAKCPAPWAPTAPSTTSPLLRAKASSTSLSSEAALALSLSRCAACSRALKGHPGVFLGRHGGTRNARPVEGAEHLEKAFEKRQFLVYADAGAVPLAELARRLYGSCRLAGFSGTAMANLVFLPPNAAVLEFNLYRLYANYWQWSHALGICYCQVIDNFDSTSVKRISREEAELWAYEALAESPSSPPEAIAAIADTSGPMAEEKVPCS